MKQQKETTFCSKQNCGSLIQYKQSWHSKDFQLMEWAFVNISSELYISQMSWSELIWFQGNLQRGLNPSQSAKQYYSKAEFAETVLFFFFFFQVTTAGCTKVGRWSRVYHFDGVLWANPGMCAPAGKVLSINAHVHRWHCYTHALVHVTYPCVLHPRANALVHLTHFHLRQIDI